MRSRADKYVAELEAKLAEAEARLAYMRERAGELSAKLVELEEKLLMLDAGIAESLAAITIEGMRAPLIGCTMRRLPLTEEDRQWAVDHVKDGA